MDGESCVLALPYGNTTFRSTSVKPYYTEEPVATDQPEQPEQPPSAEQSAGQPAGPPIATTPEGDKDTIVVDTGDVGRALPEPLAQLPKRGRGRPRKNPHLTVFLEEPAECFEAAPFQEKEPSQPSAASPVLGEEPAERLVVAPIQEEEPFAAAPFGGSRIKEVKGLVDKGVFDVVKTSEIPQGTRIFNARFVDEVKNKGTDKEFNKSRLVV